MIRVAIIIGSTRPNRVGEGVAKWVLEQSKDRTGAEFEIVDLKDFHLPLLDEPVPAGMTHHYTQPHTMMWSKKIDSFDAYLFVTPEYNHGIPAALKNAIDYLYQEWINKVAGFVAYGGHGGIRAVEQLRLVMAELQVATVRTQMVFTHRSDFEDSKRFHPTDDHQKMMTLLFDQIILWGEAFKKIRGKETEGMTPEKRSSDENRMNLH